MAKDYKKITQGILLRTRPRLASTYNLEFKSVFGAVGAYINGQIFLSCGKFGLALRLPPKTLARLLKEKRVKPLKYFEKGHVKKDYGVLVKSVLADEEQLKKLVDTSIRMALE